MGPTPVPPTCIGSLAKTQRPSPFECGVVELTTPDECFVVLGADDERWRDARLQVQFRGDPPVLLKVGRVDQQVEIRPAARGVYFINSETHPRPAVELYSFATERTRQVAAIEKELFWSGPSLAASADG